MAQRVSEFEAAENITLKHVAEATQLGLKATYHSAIPTDQLLRTRCRVTLAHATDGKSTGAEKHKAHKVKDFVFVPELIEPFSKLQSLVG